MNQISKRELLKCMLLSTVCLVSNVQAKQQPQLKIQRLNWAGVRFQNTQASLLIDPVFTDIWAGVILILW